MKICTFLANVLIIFIPLILFAIKVFVIKLYRLLSEQTILCLELTYYSDYVEI